jgi:hypothetical protein
VELRLGARWACIFARRARIGLPMRAHTPYLINEFGSSPIQSLGLVIRELLGPRDMMILQLVFEQRAVRLDQMVRFLNASPRVVQSAAKRLASLGLLELNEIVPDTPLWLSPTGAGTYVVDSKLAARQFGALPPTARFTTHLLLINELRLKFAKDRPDARWISERMLYVETHSRRRADGVIVIDGERHALEMEVTYKQFHVAKRNVVRLFEDYKFIHYYCSPEPRRVMERVQEELCCEHLYIHDLPE